MIKPFIKKVAHSKTNRKYVLSNCPIQLKNCKNEPFCSVKTACYWEENVRKQIEIPYILAVVNTL